VLAIIGWRSLVARFEIFCCIVSIMIFGAVCPIWILWLRVIPVTLLRLDSSNL